MGKNTIGPALAALLILHAAPAFSQTVVNPRTVEFDPSADHSAVSTDGVAVVQRYDLTIYPAGAATVLYTANLGKPSPDTDGKIRVDFSPLLPVWPLPNGTYEARVGAIGPGGQGQSAASNQFAFQSCVSIVSPLTLAQGTAGGTASVVVTTDAACTWTAASAVPWITISPVSGTGSGTVTLTVAANSTSALRTGTLTVAGQTVTVTQETVACVYSLGSNAQTVAAAGGSGTVSLTSLAGCAWTATSGAGWVTVSPASGSGSGTVTFTAAANTATAARTGTLTIGGQTFTVTQSAAACSYSLGSSGQAVAASGGSGTVNVTSLTGCAWSATSDAAWLSVTPNGGSGVGTVTFTAAANTATAARTGTLTIGGQTFTVTQSAAACTFALSSTSSQVGYAGASASVDVSCGSGCAWSVAEKISWVRVSPAGGEGAASVTISVSPNTTPHLRSGAVTIAGITYSISQDAKPAPHPPKGLRVVPKK
jgi:hypothetical protein